MRRLSGNCDLANERGLMSSHRPSGPPMGGPFAQRGPSGASAKNTKAAAKRLLTRLDRQRTVLLVTFGLTAAAIGLGLLGPKLLGDATTLVFTGLISARLPAGVDKATVISTLRAQGQDHFADLISGMDLTPGVGVDFNRVGHIIMVVVALYAGSALLNWVQGYLMAGVAQKAVFELRRDVEEKLSRVPLSYIDGESRGDLLSRVTNDIDNIGTSLQQGLSQLLWSVLSVVGTLGVMFYISPLLAVVSLLIVPISLVLTTQIAKRSQVQFAQQWKETGRVNGHVEEMHTGHAIVRSFNRTDQAMKEFDEYNEALFQSSFRAQFLSGIIMPMMNMLSNVNYVVIAVLGGMKVATGQLSLGGVQAFIQYSRQYTMPLAQIAAQANVLQSGLASAERVFEVLDTPEEPREQRATLIPEFRGEVRLEEISFRYLPDAPLIDHVSLDVKPGQTVAIVGPTGAGKTTIVNLLMRFYEINGGRITIDGFDAHQMAREDLRSLFGMVLQDTWLFHGTIRENIAYGNLKASNEQIVEAAKEAHADHFIRTLPLGYETVLEGDAGNISVGERQLLTIARAFLADPLVLILDEATSNVDTRTEVLIQEAMNRLRSGRTSFIIAHRLSTIRNADTILVMDQGRIIEQGSHQELIERNGFYRRLYDSQFAAN